MSATKERHKARTKAMLGKSKKHEITITISVRFDNELTPKEARAAIWNQLHGHIFYGFGKPSKDDIALGYRSAEPFDQGRITVRF